MSKQLLFDLDGTISDPGIGIRNGYRAAFEAVGMVPPDDASIDSWNGPPLREAFPELGIAANDVETAIAGYRAVYQKTGWLENELYADMTEVLSTLARHAALAIATAKPEGLARQILAHFKLDQHFDFIGGASLDSSRDSKSAVIRHVLQQLPSGDAIMIGDRKTDIAGAKMNGLSAIGVTWGYGSRDELLAAGAANVVDSPHELLQLLR